MSGREAMLCQLLPAPRGTPVQGSSTAFKRGRVEVCLQPELKAIEKAKSLEAPAGMLEEILSEME